MKPIWSVGIVAFNDGKVLLVREEEKSAHITGVYGLPSGRVEEVESELDTAVREFIEETGLAANKKDFLEFPNNLFIADLPRKDGTIKTFHHRVFFVKKYSGVLKGNPETTPGWFTFEDLNKLNREGKLLPNTINSAQAALKFI